MNRSRMLASAAVPLAVVAVLVAAGIFQRAGSQPATKNVGRDEPVPMTAEPGKPVRLTGSPTEDDHPAMTKGPDGTIWLAYVEYRPGQPIVMERVQDREFDSLVPKGNGDRIRLRTYDGSVWAKPVDVTEGGLDVWRPTVAVTGDGKVVVAWSQKVEGDWEILARVLSPAKDEPSQGSWSEILRVTRAAGSDIHVVSATDAEGRVWLVWQAWRNGQFDIDGAIVNADGTLERDVKPEFDNTEANEWKPAIAADAKGNVYVAWDTYANGNYDVRLKVFGERARTVNVADTPRFEARAALHCDGNNWLWIAYEEGDEQWGKDYQGSTPEKVGIKNLGYGLYVNRTIRVKCLGEDGRLMQPAADLQAALEKATPRARSVPRLASDAAGGVWLAFRHHRTSGGRGEAWASFVTRYDGKGWSQPQQLPNSSNIIDNLPQLAAVEGGLLVVRSSDSRTATRNRDQDDLFASVLAVEGAAVKPKLIPDRPDRRATVKTVHPNEDADVARIRGYRVKVGNRTLQLLRGEFHRHTEYTAHRDQDGLLEDSWRFALDAGRLDWMGNGDHDNGFGQEYMWWQIQKISDLYHNPPHFIAALTYERSVRYPSGHRNVMFARRGIRPLPRLSGNQRLYGTPDEGAPDVKLLYDYLKHFRGICAVHTSGTNMGTDWRDNDPDVEPIVEIYQAHRHNYEHFGAPRSATKQTQIGGYQPAGFVWNALAKGYRLGFQSSSDHVGTHMSYAIVLTDDPSRQGILDAFRARRCYAATDNIVLIVQSGDHLMGEEFTTDRPPSFEITVKGTAPLGKVHIIRDNKYIYTHTSEDKEATFQYTDADAKPGSKHYYYVRVDQSDGNLAWGSPMWITFQPKRQ